MARRGRAATRLTAPYLRELRVDPVRIAGKAGHPFDLPLVRGLELVFKKPVTVIVGENGTGKSTLLEAIAELAGFPTYGGTKNHGFGSTGDDARLTADLEQMDPSGAKAQMLARLREDRRLTSALRAAWLPKVTDGFFFRAETFFDVARYLDESALYGGGPPPPQHLKRSHAEGVVDFFDQRLSGALHRGRPCLFVFDEPEAALSPTRQLAFLRWMKRVEDTGRAQVIIATHAPLLMAHAGADLWRIADGRVGPVALEDVDHFRALREFAADPHGYVTRNVHTDRTDDD